MHILNWRWFGSISYFVTKKFITFDYYTYIYVCHNDCLTILKNDSAHHALILGFTCATLNKVRWANQVKKMEIVNLFDADQCEQLTMHLFILAVAVIQYTESRVQIYGATLLKFGCMEASYLKIERLIWCMMRSWFVLGACLAQWQQSKCPLMWEGGRRTLTIMPRKNYRQGINMLHPMNSRKLSMNIFRLQANLNPDSEILHDQMPSDGSFSAD